MNLQTPSIPLMHVLSESNYEQVLLNVHRTPLYIQPLRSHSSCVVPMMSSQTCVLHLSLSQIHN